MLVVPLLICLVALIRSVCVASDCVPLLGRLVSFQCHCRADTTETKRQLRNRDRYIVASLHSWPVTCRHACRLALVASEPIEWLIFTVVGGATQLPK